MKYKKIDELEDGICENCHLHRNATCVKVAPRYGTGDCILLLVGEAPGRDEDMRGRAFTGPSGRQLDALIYEAGIPLENVGMTNVVRCVPWKNAEYKAGVRAPNEEEVFECIDYLFAEIRNVQPKVLVPLGGTAAHYAIGMETTITKGRGEVYEVAMGDRGIKAVPTFHPASILRGATTNRGAVIRDLRRAWRVAHGLDTYYLPKFELLNDTYRAIEVINEITDRYIQGEIPYVAYDMESINMDPYIDKKRFLGMSFAGEAGMGYFIPFWHKQSRVNVDKLMPHLERFFATCKFVGHNIKFDLLWTYMSLGFEFEMLFDTAIASNLLYGEVRLHRLKPLTQDFLDYPDYSAELNKCLDLMQKRERHFGNIPLDVLAPYAAYDATGTFGLAEKFMPLVMESSLNLPWELLRQSLYVFSEIEVNGWMINTEKLTQLEIHYVKRRDHYYRKLLTYKGAQWLLRGLKDPKVDEIMAKSTFPDKLKDDELKYLRKLCNFNSHPQMRKVMFKYYKAPVLDMTSQDEASTAEKTVVNAQEMFAAEGNTDAAGFMENLWVCRKIGKAITSYLRKIPRHLREGTDLIKFTYNLHGAKTGRFTMQEYAIHTTPRKSDVKRCFISRWRNEGGLVLDGDYSQWEMRIFALIADEPDMIAAFEKGYDIYLYIGAEVYGIPMEEITDLQRQIAKKTALGIIYGEGPKGVAKNAGITVEAAKDVINRFYRRFRMVKAYVDAIWTEVSTHGFVRTIMGRARYFPAALSDLDDFQRGEIQRQSQNFPIQSVASDLTLVALLSMKGRLLDRQMKSMILGFVHDGVPVDVHPGELFKVLREFKAAMTTELADTFEWLKIPIKAGFELGASWGGTLKITDWNEDGMVKMKGKKLYYDELIEIMGRAYTFDVVSCKEKQAGLSAEYEFGTGGAYLGYGGGNIDVEAELKFTQKGGGSE